MMTDTNKTPDGEGLFHLLHRAEQRAKVLFAEEARGLDLTVRQLVILNAVSDHGAPMQTDIVRLTGIDRSTVTELVGRMVKRGLLTRERNARDARAYVVQVSDEGMQRLRAAAEASERAGRRFIETVPVDQRAGFLTGLQSAALTENGHELDNGGAANDDGSDREAA
ncbi:MAG: MarR family transcriptional regulator [Pseudomonadota bacterium]